MQFYRLLASIVAMSAITVPAAWGGDLKSHPVVTGDTWVYKQITEAPGQNPSSDTRRFRVAYRTREGRLAVLAAPAKLTGPDVIWQIAYLVSDDTCILDVPSGESLGLGDSCKAALAPGMAWESDSTGRQLRTHERYQVLGREQVQVPAGTYEAFRIDSVGTAGGKRLYTIFWYAPDVKGMVKVVREFLDASDRLSLRLTEELMPEGAHSSGNRP